MKIKALCSFAGVVSMAPGQIREVDDTTAQGLIRAGYAEAVIAPTSTGYVVGSIEQEEAGTADESENIPAGRPEKPADAEQAPAPPKAPPKRTRKKG